ncbi:MAG: hypothetical protein JMN27_15055 [gamma proteobacterium endosymbiont of Lamellibrachia anaximandri]|nr:hypothetical protein [gamma proteobacterium endosymbiont of Lamellibrachia anaximandri]MBL3535129.1 hypothetical protein [gamma proteobacterium endosymbiont of Lamellibrachia anaximandri]
MPEQITFGELKEHQGLAVLPIQETPSSPQLDYLTLDVALALGHVRITEVNDSGSVPELLLENSAPKPVLLVDGEELVGAKQNRVLNLTILAPANQKIVIPVSCVEAGRWNHDSSDFANSNRAHFAKGRAKKMASVSESMHSHGERRSNQGEVWADIDTKFSRMDASSHTSAMSDLYEKAGSNLEDYVTAFETTAKQIGAFFYVHGRLVGFDLFDKSVTCTRLFKKLLRSYAIDALEQPVTEQPPLDIDHAESLLALLRAGEWQTYPAIGMGTDYRFSSPRAAAAGLVVDDTTIHLSGFILNCGTEATDPEGRMASARIRRRMRTH